MRRSRDPRLRRRDEGGRCETRQSPARGRGRPRKPSTSNDDDDDKLRIDLDRLSDVSSVEFGAEDEIRARAKREERTGDVSV